MKYGLFSGILWGLDTFILGLAFLLPPFSDNSNAALTCAFIHDVCCALLLLCLMIKNGSLASCAARLRTRGAIVVMLGALLGGPLGMSGYIAAINTIGSAHTAIISAFYPAVGSFFAVVLLREHITWQRVVALCVALAGVIVIGLHTSSASVEGNIILGVAAALLCVFGWGSEAVFLEWGLRETEELDTTSALFLREVTSAVVYGAVVIPIIGCYPAVASMATAGATWYVVAAAVAGMASYMWYYKAIVAIGAARAMAFNISYCAWALIFSALYTQVMPDTLELVCCVAIFVGTTLSATADWSELAFWASWNTRRKNTPQ